MASLLIVDDEDFAVEGIKASVPWADLGIDSIQTAFNVAQAREILSRAPVDIVLSDIEMPQENGLKLLAWMREAGCPSELIFLTAHDDFALVREALRLRSFDYLVKPVAPAELSAVIRRILGSDSRVGQAVAEPLADPGVEGTPELPDTTRWVILLKGGATERVRYEVRAFLDKVPVRSQNGALLLRRLLLDFQQVLATALRSKNLSSHDLLRDAGSADLFHKATDSRGDFVRWVDYALDAATDRLQKADKGASPFGLACAYIAQHVSEDLSCEQIAAHVDLNPDYLTRLFKKETGLSVSNYVAKARMVFAGELLLGTKQPVSDVATQIGYANPANFSKVFKKVFGLTPVEYRTQRAPGKAVQ